MQKKVFKKVPYRVANFRVQKLYQELWGNIGTGRLGEVLEEIEDLPILNKDTIMLRNRRGVMIAVVGKKGSYRKYSVDFCRGAWYFDGNRLGKRKMKMVDALFTDNVEGINHQDEMIKVWKKIHEQSIAV